MEFEELGRMEKEKETMRGRGKKRSGYHLRLVVAVLPSLDHSSRRSHVSSVRYALE
jgi:hypothetical protein